MRTIRNNLKEKMILGVLLYLAVVMGSLGTAGEARAEVKSEYEQDIALDETHFPDVQLRKQLARSVDINKDGILSVGEREKIHYLWINSGYSSSMHKYWYTDMKCMEAEYVQDEYVVYPKNKCALVLCHCDIEGNQLVPEKSLNLTGIEYFFNLEEVRINKYELVSGFFQNNINLKKIWVGCTESGQKSYENIREDFPVSQQTYLHLKNISVDTLNVEKMPNLQVLRIFLPEGSNRRLATLNLSKNAKLRELELANIMPGKLDLRKNPKISSVKVYSGKCKNGQGYGATLDEDAEQRSAGGYRYYLPEKNQKCKVVFPKKNSVKTFYYFTGDNKIDITRLTKLEDFQTLKTTKARVKSEWIRRTFTKKNWGCAIVKSGKFLKKIKAEKKKKITLL